MRRLEADDEQEGSAARLAQELDRVVRGEVVHPGVAVLLATGDAEGDAAVGPLPVEARRPLEARALALLSHVPLPGVARRVAGGAQQRGEGGDRGIEGREVVVHADGVPVAAAQ